MWSHSLAIPVPQIPHSAIPSSSLMIQSFSERQTCQSPERDFYFYCFFKRKGQSCTLSLMSPSPGECRLVFFLGRASMIGHLPFLASEESKCHHWLERNLQTAMNGLNIYTSICPILTLSHALGGVIYFPVSSMSRVLLHLQCVFQLFGLVSEFTASRSTQPCARCLVYDQLLLCDV